MLGTGRCPVPNINLVFIEARSAIFSNAKNGCKHRKRGGDRHLLTLAQYDIRKTCEIPLDICEIPCLDTLSAGPADKYLFKLNPNKDDGTKTDADEEFLRCDVVSTKEAT